MNRRDTKTTAQRNEASSGAADRHLGIMCAVVPVVPVIWLGPPVAATTPWVR